MLPRSIQRYKDAIKLDEFNEIVESIPVEKDPALLTACIRGTRPIEWTPRIIDEAARMHAMGLDIDKTAFALGVHPQTFKQKLANDRIKFENGDMSPLNLYCALAVATASMKDKVALTAYQIAVEQKNPDMIKFLCRTRLRWRDAVGVEVSGPKGEPVRVNAVVALADISGKVKEEIESYSQTAKFD